MWLPRKQEEEERSGSEANIKTDQVREENLSRTLQPPQALQPYPH